MSLSPGTRLGSYEVTALIGPGRHRGNVSLKKRRPIVQLGLTT